ncbi:hypothetical protein [Haladaptatus sp. DJG-WS-42]|uniref:hypothetical protein n=1 Tax=Haladaptatus sp. DJG-WS-42 TaxID=3120516 RepID=UPI0030CDFF26
MNFDERFGDLFERGEREQARELAKAVLRNEPVNSIEVTDTVVHVQTPSFYGTHQVTTDRDGVIDIQRQGTYRYKSEAIDLSFTTKTMTDAAYDQARARLRDQYESASDTVE